MEKLPGVGVGVIVRRGKQVLLLRRIHAHGAGSWSSPGGHLEFMESPEQCAIRETKEETGLDIRNPRFVALTNDLFPADDRHYITIWMEAEAWAGDAIVNAPDESDAIGWFAWDELPEPLFIPLQNLLAGQCYPAVSLRQ